MKKLNEHMVQSPMVCIPATICKLRQCEHFTEEEKHMGQFHQRFCIPHGQYPEGEHRSAYCHTLGHAQNRGNNFKQHLSDLVTYFACKKSWPQEQPTGILV